MKNIIRTLFLFLVCAGFASCDNSVGIPDRGPQGNPEKEIAGTYTGTWTRTLSGQTESTTSTGTITFSPTDKSYVTNVAVSCPDLNINMNAVANVVNYSEGFMYYNRENKNGFGVAFDGRVIEGNASIKFTLSVKEGRKQYLYNYTFNGGK